jgi:hypothetical protein
MDRAGGVAAVGFGVAMVLSACSAELGSIPMATLDPSVSVKVLRPRAVARACRSSLLGLGADAGLPLDAAVRALLASDQEANALTEVSVQTSTITTGIYNRWCVEIRGDLVRVISTVVLPAVGAHHH